MGAWRAACLGAQVTLLEKNLRVGTKILISGGGKCNITHGGELEDVLRAFRPIERNFIRPACYKFRNEEIVEIFTSRGIEVYTRPDGRIFPVEKTAKDVVSVLYHLLIESGVEVRLGCAVTSISETENRFSVVTENEIFNCEKLLVTVGGKSYPATGSTGEGWNWLKKLGHTVTTLGAALAPIILDPEPKPEYAGIALRDVIAKARKGTKEVVRFRGDLLFTHHGISGPATLGIARDAAEFDAEFVEIDCLPDKSFEVVKSELDAWVSANPRKELQSWVQLTVPARIVDWFCEGAEIDSKTPVMQLSKKQKNRLIEVAKGWKIGRIHEVVLLRGEVTAGGIALEEVEPTTMQSKLKPGLFLAGEILDIAGPVGGYNLQAAFATGFLAGESIAEKL